MNKIEKKKYILNNTDNFIYQIKFYSIYIINLINKLRIDNNLLILFFNTKINIFDFWMKENMEIMFFPYKKNYLLENI